MSTLIERTGRYQPFDDPDHDLVVCLPCSKPDVPAVIPRATIPAHDLWHSLPAMPRDCRTVTAPWPRLRSAAE